MARLSRSTMVAELSPPAKCQGPDAPANEAGQASGFEQAVAAVVKLAASKPCEGQNSSALPGLRLFMPSCLVHAFEQLRSGRTTMTARELHVLADAAFLFTSARPIVETFLEQELTILELVNNTPEPELNEVARSIVLLSSIQCLPRTPEAMVLFKHEVPSIRWMSVSCMAEYLSLSVPEVETLTDHAVPSASMRFACESGLQRRQRQLQTLAASMWDMKERDTSYQALREAIPSPPGFVNLCGALVRCKPGTTPQHQPAQAHFVSTPAMQSAVHSAALALSTSRCVLISGPTGCGKSCLVHQLAAATSQDGVLELYMDANTDSRALLGSYMCSQTPGEFFWQPGPLSQAVRTGRWLVLDNLHLAPADVLTTLETVISSRVLHVPQRGEVIPAHPDFRLIATVQTGTSAKSEEVRHVLPRAVLSDWWHVRLPAVQRHEQVQVLAGRFPSINALLYPLIALAHLVYVAIRPPSTSTNEPLEPQAQDTLWDPWTAAVHNAMRRQSLRPGELLLSVSRAPGMHDLVKVCARLVGLGGTAAALQHVYGVRPSSTTRTQLVSLPVDARTAMLVEAADVFCGCTVGMEAKVKQLRAMAHVLGLPPEDGERVLKQKSDINLQAGTFCVGRARLPCSQALSGPSSHDILMGMSGKSNKFAHTTHSSQSMQSIAVAVQMSEPLLLVGESGTGKTTIIQHVAEQVGKEIVAINLSSQSESSDLLGGMKPVQVGATMLSLHRKFTQLLQNTWPAGKNADFLTRVHKFVRDENWTKLIEAFEVALKKVSHTKTASNENERPTKKVRLSVNTINQWDEFASEMGIAKRTVAVSTQGFAFEFVEGALVHALRTGQWLLLDEINMAPPQVLESIMCVLDSSAAGLSLLDQPGSQRLQRHPDFRIFGAMNPATDTGKRQLPSQINALFTEVHIPEARNREDLVPIIKSYLPGMTLPAKTLDGIVDFFKEAREMASGLSDGSSAPAYNLRTLARSLQYICHAASLHGKDRALFDGFSMFFASMLEASSAAMVVDLLKQHVVAEPSLPSVTRSLPKALSQRTERFINVEGYWIVCGNEPLPDEGGPSVQDFILTKTVKSHLRAVARALTMQPQCPILLQGPTSSGKTTLVEHIARMTGHKTIRINNHQHTDLQEYLGAYSADDQGNLVFHEGALVRAARNGDWVILDELNLAPTDVLEALNRLLDDNHELFVPELQETIKPHPQFMLFGTQNPAGAYAGRKMLSRALRSRFLQIMIPDLPSSELITVLEQRCAIPASHAGKLVTVMNELRILRSHGNVFAGCHGLITPRDIFRWASRQGRSYEELAMHGHSLLAERLRTQDERNQVLRILCDVTKTKFDPASAFAKEGEALQAELQQAVDSAEQSELVHQVRHVVWTKTLQRMFYLAKQALEHKEAVLLVGETGAGKTTLSQTLTFVRGQPLVTISCNMHTEAADFLGGYRPARNRNKAFSEFVASYNELARFVPRSLEMSALGTLPPPPNELDTHQITTSLQALESAVKSMPQAGHTDSVAHLLEAARVSAATACIPFMWEDGPLVTAMRQGCLLLVDEINLAEDAVLERLNSVLEPGRTLLLAEKGGPSAEQIVAAEGFRVIATMNPGGDHGKRELSPALSNRFTQVWVSDIDDSEDIFKLVHKHLPSAAGFEVVAAEIVKFWEWYSHLEVMGKAKLSNRDLLAWCQFICEMQEPLGSIPAFLHGIFLVLIDGLGSGAVGDDNVVRNMSVQYLHNSIESCYKHDLELAACLDTCQLPTAGAQECLSDDGMKSGTTLWGIAPFVVPVGLNYDPDLKHLYHLDAPTTSRNTFRLLRAMQVPKPILLEGSPGVGKTSLITTIAAAMGHELIRVNLSEQTEMADLLGADLPAPDGTAGAFQWAQGPLLRAVRSGAWVILDELNLASQAVLEGLNSVLDHRREIFIPELDETVRCAPSFRVFAAQNPVQEGGGRKALPKSFLNRFSRITLELLKPGDLLVILQQLHPQLPVSCLECIVRTVGGLHDAINVRRVFGRTGAPWEFNLRDASRWCDLINAAHISSEEHAVALSGHYAEMLFSHKMQTKADKQQAEDLIAQCWRSHAMHDVFEKYLRSPARATVALSADKVRIGWCELSRDAQVITLPRGAGREGSKTVSCSASGLELACASVPAVEWIATACKLAWMAVVMSPDVQRATRVVRMLAAACSQPLVEIPMSDTSDISDLLGGFEQMDFVRQLRGALSQVQHVAVLMVKDILSAGDYSAHSAQRTLRQLQQVQRLQIGTDESAMLQKAPATVKELQQGVTDLRAVHAQGQWSPAVSNLIYDVLVAAAAAVAEVAAMVKGGKVVSTGGRFVWVDGLLLSAIEHGHWVLMLHANTCSAAVLDRLNSLLEPCGSLYINECGSCAGGPRIVKPHANFRLLIVMDPSEGGLSRAMRNRGVEIFLDAHKFDDDPSAQLSLEEVNRAAIPGAVLPEWLQTQLSSSKYLFRDALWQRQYNAQLLYALRCLVESGAAPLEGLMAVQELVPATDEGISESTVERLVDSFSTVSLREQGCESSRPGNNQLSLTSSCSSLAAFPPLECAVKSVTWQVASALLRVPNVLLSQLICTCIVRPQHKHKENAVHFSLPPLITLPDVAGQDRGSTASCLNDAYASVQLLLTTVSGGTSVCVHNQLNQDWDELKAYFTDTTKMAANDCVQHIEYWYKSTMEALQPEKVAEVHQLPQELLPPFAAAQASCEQLAVVLHKVQENAAAPGSKPRTVADLSATLAHQRQGTPLFLHNVVPVVVPLLYSLQRLQSSVLSGVVCNPEHSLVLLQGLRQLQLAMSHMLHISMSNEWEDLPRSISQRLLYLMMNVSELWDVFTGLQASVPCLRLQSTQSALYSFSTELATAKMSLQLQSHAAQANLLCTRTGHLKLPAAPQQCEQWLMLQQLSMSFEPLHLATAVHALAAVSASVQQWESLCCTDAETASAAEKEQKLRSAAALLACSQSSKNMLSEGAALLLAEMIGPAELSQTSDSESFCSEVVLRTKESVEHILQSCQSLKHASPAAEALVMQPLAPQHLMHSTGIEFQAALSQLEVLMQSPMLQGCLALVSIAPQVPDLDTQEILHHVLTTCKQSSVASPLMSASLQVVSWSSAQDNPDLIMKAAHVARWHSSKSSLFSFRAPFKFRGIALAELLPWKLRDALSHPSELPGHCAASFTICQPLPLCLSYMLAPAAVTLQAMPSCKAALSQTLHNLLALLASTQLRIVPPVLLHLAAVTATASQALHAFSCLVQELGALASLLAQVARAVCCAQLAGLPDVVGMCHRAIEPACAAMQSSSIPGLPEGCAVIRELVHCIQKLVSDTTTMHDSHAVGAKDMPPSNLAKVGQVTVELSAWRAALLKPPPGFDPAMMAVEERHHVQYISDVFVSPWLRVCRASQSVPLLPDDTTHEITALELQLKQAETKCSELQMSCVPRPDPPQYDELVSAIDKCEQIMIAAVREVSSSVAEIMASTSEFEASSAAQLMSQCDKQASDLAAWADRIEASFPLYADQYSPFVLAVRDAHAGLSMLRTALQQHVQQHSIPALHDSSFLRSCFQYPITHSHSDTGLQPLQDTVAACSSPAVTSAVKEAVLQRLTGAVPEKVLHALPKTLEVRLQLKGHMLQLQACSILSGPQVQEMLQRTLSDVITLWNVGKELQAELQAREESIYKSSRTQQIIIRSEEEELDAEVSEAVSKATTLFADLMATPDAMDSADANISASMKEDASSLVVEQLTVMLGDTELQKAIVDAHKCGLSRVLMQYNRLDSPPEPMQPSSNTNSVTDGLSTVGMQLLEACGGYSTTDMARSSISACVQRVLGSLSQLNAAQSGYSEVVDVFQPCLAEMMLAVAPVQSLSSTVAALLDRFPEQPMLEKLQTICKRILGLSANGSLKDAMIGVELLVANVDEWQKRSASVKEQTSLAQHQGPLAALAARWRSLELKSWSANMSKALERIESGAYVHWFHLMSVCFPSNGSTPEISNTLPVIEQFLQSSSMGQFEARLALLKLCCKHCSVLVASGQRRFAELATFLQNVHSYYAQHVPAVQQILEGTLGTIRKEMKDFVTLQRWDHHGAHDLKLMIEKAQRKLATCNKRTQAAATELITPALATFASSIGMELVRKLASSSADVSNSEAAADVPVKPESTALASNTLPRLVQSVVGLSTSWARMVEFPEIVHTWMASQCANLKQGRHLHREAEALARHLGPQLSDTSFWRNRDHSKPTAQLLAIVSQPSTCEDTGSAALSSSQTLPAVLQGVSQAASSLFDEAGSLADRMSSVWSHDGQKGSRAMRKKALTDLIKLLTCHGLSTSKMAVPKRERSQEAWWMRKQQPNIPKRVLTAVPAPMGTQGGSPGYLEEAWPVALECFQQVMGGVGCLQRACKDNLHSDISQREVSQMCSIAEHAWYLMRWQHHQVHDGCEQLCVLEHSVELLETATACASDCFRSSADHSKLQTQLRALVNGTEELQLFMQQLQTLCPPSSTLRSKPLAQTFKKAKQAIAGLLESLRSAQEHLNAAVAAASLLGRSHSTCDIHCKPAVFTATLLQAMHATAVALKDCHTVVHETGSSTVAEMVLPATQKSLQVRDIYPSWTRLETLTEQIMADVVRARADGPPTDETTSEVPEAKCIAARDDGDNAVKEYADCVEQSLKNTLRWAQEAVKAHTEIGAPLAVSVLSACTQAPSLEKLCAALGSCAQFAGKLPGSDPRVAALVAQLRGVLPMVRAVLIGLRATVVHAVMLQMALSQVTLVTVAVFHAYVKDGFGEGVSEEQDGQDGEGTGTFKQEQGTGLGDGDTADAQDVSNQIENEDQIMGAHQQGMQEDEPEGQDDKGQENETGDADGVEMEQDFDGEMHDGELEVDGEEDAAEAEKELEKEMGDAGDDAEVLDEKLWFGEDEGGEGEENESRKDAGASDSKINSKSDDDNRKMVAGGEDEQEDEKGDGDKADDAQENADDQDKVEDVGGLMEEGEVAEQMEGQDSMQPQAEQPELQVPEDLNLDYDAMDEGEEDAGGDDAAGEAAQDEEDPVNTSDAKKAEAAEDAEMQQDGDDDDDGAAAALSADGDNADENDGTDDAAARQDAKQVGADQPEEEEQAENPEADADKQQMDSTQPQKDSDDAAADQSIAGPQGGHSTAAQDERPEGAGASESAATAANKKDNQAQKPGGGAQEQQYEPEGEEKDKDDSAANEAQAQEKGANAGAADAPLQYGVQETGDAEPEAAASRSGTQRQRANPLHDLGSAQKQWRKDFDIVQDVSDADEEMGDAQTDEADAAAGQAMRFANQEDTNTKDQALAAATQEQAEEQARAGADPDGQEGKHMEAQEPDADEDMQIEPASVGDPTMQSTGQQERSNQDDHTMEDVHVEDAEPAGHLDASADLARLDEGNFAAVETQAVDVEMVSTGITQGQHDNEANIQRDVSAEADTARGYELWQKCSAATAGLTGELIEQLSLVLQPTLASKLSGGYKTGKRLNMKKLIRYIASSFRQDKIWMRRTVPNQRQYQVLLAIDETKSMKENRCDQCAMEALTLMTSALSRLEVGTMGVAAYGGQSGTRVLHDLSQPWTDESAASVLGGLRFDADNTLEHTPLLDLLKTAGDLFTAETHQASGSAVATVPSQLLLIVADGHFHERTALQQAVRQVGCDSSGEGPLIVMIILDAAKQSILDLQQVVFENGEPSFMRYLDGFPFPYYMVLRDIQRLPHLLADLLRQWIQVCCG